MAIEPRILYKCNHIIDRKELKYGCIELTRNSENYPDSPSNNIKILRVDRVYKDDIEYTPELDYTQKLSTNTIEWNNVSNAPNVGDKYVVQCLYTLITTSKHDADDCPRCFGNAWFINILNDGKIETYTGINKLVQDVVKALFTDKNNNYGSELKDLVSKNIYNKVDLDINVTSIIDECQRQIKAQQSEQMSNGCTLEEEEILDELIIKNLIFVKEEMTCYITIEIKNLLGNTAMFTFAT